MKNIIKILGIIAFIAVIGFFMTGCGENASWTLEVVNLSSYDLTVYMQIGHNFETWGGKISKGRSNSITYKGFGDPPDPYSYEVLYYPTGNIDRIVEKQGYISPHSTETITINDSDIPPP